jgi:sugar-specific transcriptional regulator TrmB
MGKRGPRVGEHTGKKTGILIRYTEEDYQEILDGIAAGKTLLKICEKTSLPNRSAVYRRAETDPAFKERLKEAQKIRCSVLEEQVQEIADDESKDHTPAAVYRARLKIDTRKWLLSILDPEKYAQYNKQRIAHEGMAALPQPIINISFDGVDNAAKDGSDQHEASPEAEGSTAELCN